MYHAKSNVTAERLFSLAFILTAVTNETLELARTVNFGVETLYTEIMHKMLLVGLH